MTQPAQTQRAAVILAAGKGTRMKSSLPKVLHEVAGKPMIDWSIDLARRAGCDPICVVCSPGQEELVAHIENRLGAGSVAFQHEQLGTGHAVQSAAEALSGAGGSLVVLYGDTPLIRPEAVQDLFAALDAGAAVGVLGFHAREPGAYGRLILDDAGALARIVEAKDASAEELAVTLCNSGVIAAPAEKMFSLLGQVTNENAKGEYYLTDIVGLARAAGHRNTAVVCAEDDVLGVNSRVQLAEANAAFQARRRRELMESGVTLVAPETVFLSHDTEIAPDCVIEPNVVFGPGVVLASHVHVRAFSHIEGAHVASGAVIGPYARLRPGAEVGAKARVGNFVEIKNARLEEGAKVNHLSYVGDGFVGAGANLGAGTIFCNYDGYNKHQTRVGAGAFVGSNSALVAPVTIGKGAYVGSGSVITEDVPEDALSLARGKQVLREGWAIRYRAKMTGESEE
ncbi:MAG: bifunctional UDP-N-acetylglucosamine diphosphorylase/glucosamine-1-phosphate N-acetyltransferase GlmU [Hyphomonadaceae bacterium]|nr:bifunctional UDP-N-acetylglucosamine diphosphorylase/glucosamine-1-phosphate N-acetyltransferase GlmU [Hyphomonadaceae bacterium]